VHVALIIEAHLLRALVRRQDDRIDRKKNLGGFSGGMKQRFGIAQALLSNPKLIIVDEPTAGLDPTERNRFLNLLSELGEDAIVILSTHLVDDVKELCTDMLIINDAITRVTSEIIEERNQLRQQKQTVVINVDNANISYTPEVEVDWSDFTD